MPAHVKHRPLIEMSQSQVGTVVSVYTNKSMDSTVEETGVISKVMRVLDAAGNAVIVEFAFQGESLRQFSLVERKNTDLVSWVSR